MARWLASGAGCPRSRALFWAPLGAVLLLACGVTEHQVLEPTAEPVSGPSASAEDASTDGGQDAAPAPLALDAGPWLDPDAHFEWSPPRPGTCAEGSYEGGFECAVGLGLLSGEIKFTLVGSAEEQALHVEQGSFADLTGTICGTLEGDCIGSSFEATSVDLGAACSSPMSAFAAFQGDPTGSSLSGRWQMYTSDGNCEGRWSAQASP